MIEIHTVSIDATQPGGVPEPSSLVLTGGAGLFALRAWRRRQARA
jgi:hypothetical protein